MASGLEPIFPNLQTEAHAITSPKTPFYNCIAWAAGDSTRWWWPLAPYYWPYSAPREVTIAAFVAAFATIGYRPCSSGAVEDGLEKVAIYADRNNRPTHAARQLPDGTWTSKLGKLHDIEHATLRGVEGEDYGAAVLFLSRPSPGAAKP